MRLSVEETFRKYGDRIFSAAFSVCRNKADADDVVQETLIRYFSLDKEFESEEHLKAWLLRVAINRGEDGICYVQLKTDSGPLYLTVKYNDGYSTSPDGYLSPEEFNTTAD